jgi:hypothetical protein
MDVTLLLLLVVVGCGGGAAVLLVVAAALVLAPLLLLGLEPLLKEYVTEAASVSAEAGRFRGAQRACMHCMTYTAA